MIAVPGYGRRAGSGIRTAADCYASPMDLVKMLADLREERALIEEAAIE